MRYVRYDPDPRLRDYIECYWTMHNIGSGSVVSEEHVVADPGIELFFNFGEGYRRREMGSAEKGEVVNGSHLVGLRTRAIIVDQRGHIHIFGVRFRPFGLALLLPFPLSEVTHRVCSIREVFGSRAGEIEERLGECRDDDARIRDADSILLSAYGNAEPGSLIGRKAALLMSRSRGEISVRRLCEATGMGYKSLERAFRREVGVTPKLYARLLRFQAAASLIAASAARGAPLPDGYYDQSHFIREFQRFAGESPHRFFSRKERISAFLLERERESNLYNTARGE